METLLAGNTRFVAESPTATNPSEHRPSLAAGQSPIAAVLRCADSRVAPEIVFDQPLGKLFVCSVAGNVPTREIVESLEFAVWNFAIPLIVVMGHSSCSAVEVALHSDAPEGLFRKIAIAPNQGLVECISHNAQHGAKTILDTSPSILHAVESGSLCVASGVQDIASGKFTFLECFEVDTSV